MLKLFVKYYQYKFSSKTYAFLLFLIASSFNSFTQAGTELQRTQSLYSRYAPGVESIVNSHQYIQEHKALTYWKISPYYLSQQNGSSCSLATATMVINAALSDQQLSASQPLATQDDLLMRVKNKDWSKGVQAGGEGVTLEQLKTYMSKALEAYGLHNFTLEVVHVKNTSKENERILHKALVENEKTGLTFLIANFNHKFFTGGTSVGHFSPVGAYDSQTKRILILDVYRKLYEPYWVPEKLFLEAMATIDNEAKNYRGYLLVKMRTNSHNTSRLQLQKDL